MSQPCRFLSLLVFAFGLLVVAGCGGGAGKKAAVLKGKVILPSNIKLGESDSASINFNPETEGDPNLTAVVNPVDLTFTATGVKGKGTPPGNYKISVVLQPYTPGVSPLRQACDELNNRYSDGSTPLSYNLTEEPQQSITIDLSKGTVTKN